MKDKTWEYYWYSAWIFSAGVYLLRQNVGEGAMSLGVFCMIATAISYYFTNKEKKI